MFSGNLLTKWGLSLPQNVRYFQTSTVLERLRKGTRMKREKYKKLRKMAEMQTVNILPRHKLLDKEKIGTVVAKLDDSGRREKLMDNVYFMDEYKFKYYTMEEVFNMIKERQHPTQFNHPESNVIVQLEMSMSTPKEGQYISEYSRVLSFPHRFNHTHGRTIFAICDGADEKMVTTLRDMGINMVMGLEVINLQKKGEVDLRKYDHVLCDARLLPDLLPLRKTLKTSFPSAKAGTTGSNLVQLSSNFLYGVEYKVEKHKYDLDYAKVVTPIGTLAMSVEQLRTNLSALVLDVEKEKSSKRRENTIQKVMLTCPNFENEFFLVDKEELLDEIVADEDSDEEAFSGASRE